MKYKLRVTGQFKKDLKRCLKRGYKESEFEYVVNKLLNGEELDAKHHAHKLNSKFHHCWECHINPDWLLLWDYFEDELVLLLLQTGTHSDMFD